MSVAELINQKSGEQVIFVMHRHPITFIPIIFLFLILMAVPIIVYLIISNLFPALLTGFPFYPLAVLFASVYYLSIYLFFYGLFIDFYLDIWLITNFRVVDIEQHGLFSRVTTELELLRIQDVTAEVKGVFPTIFNYGNVNIKTASSTKNITFMNIPNPNHIREQLIILADEDRKLETQNNL